MEGFRLFPTVGSRFVDNNMQCFVWKRAFFSGFYICAQQCEQTIELQAIISTQTNCQQMVKKQYYSHFVGLRLFNCITYFLYLENDLYLFKETVDSFFTKGRFFFFQMNNVIPRKRLFRMIVHEIFLNSWKEKHLKSMIIDLSNNFNFNL